MKRLFILCLTFLLWGCQNNEPEVAIKALVETEVVVNNAFYIEDHLMPNYTDYKDISLSEVSDWDEVTTITVKAGDTLSYTFTQEECLRAIEIKGDDVAFDLQYDDGEIASLQVSEYQYFNEPILTEFVTLVFRTPGTISELHIISDLKVDEPVYNAYEALKAKQNKFLMGIKWQDTLQENIHLLDELYLNEGYEYLLSLSQPVDYYQLNRYNEVYRGLPVTLAGQVILNEEVDGHYWVHVETFNYDQPIKLYSKTPISDEKVLNCIGLFLTVDDTLVFYSLK